MKISEIVIFRRLKSLTNVTNFVANLNSSLNISFKLQVTKYAWRLVSKMEAF